MNSLVTVVLCSLGENGDLKNPEEIKDIKTEGFELAGFHRVYLNGQ